MLGVVKPLPETSRASRVTHGAADGSAAPSVSASDAFKKFYDLPKPVAHCLIVYTSPRQLPTTTMTQKALFVLRRPTGTAERATDDALSLSQSSRLSGSGCDTAPFMYASADPRIGSKQSLGTQQYAMFDFPKTPHVANRNTLLRQRRASHQFFDPRVTAVRSRTNMMRFESPAEQQAARTCEQRERQLPACGIGSEQERVATSKHGVAATDLRERFRCNTKAVRSNAFELHHCMKRSITSRARFGQTPERLCLATCPLDPLAQMMSEKMRFDAENVYKNPQCLSCCYIECPTRCNVLYIVTKIIQQAVHGFVLFALEITKSDVLTTRPVALKVMIRKYAEHPTKCHENIYAGMKFQSIMKGHPNLLPIDFMGYTDTCVFVVMEYAEFEDLSEVLKKRSKPLNESEARWVFHQIIQAGYYMHCRHMAFQDHSLENVLMFRCANNIIPRITDPGQAIYLNYDAQGQPIAFAKGTPSIALRVCAFRLYTQAHRRRRWVV